MTEPDDVDMEGVEVELDADLPPRNASDWRPIDVRLQRSDRD